MADPPPTPKSSGRSIFSKALPTVSSFLRPSRSTNKLRRPMSKQLPDLPAELEPPPSRRGFFTSATPSSPTSKDAPLPPLPATTGDPLLISRRPVGTKGPPPPFSLPRLPVKPQEPEQPAAQRPAPPPALAPAPALSPTPAHSQSQLPSPSVPVSVMPPKSATPALVAPAQQSPVDSTLSILSAYSRSSQDSQVKSSDGDASWKGSSEAVGSPMVQPGKKELPLPIPEKDAARSLKIDVSGRGSNGTAAPLPEPAAVRPTDSPTLGPGVGQPAGSGLFPHPSLADASLPPHNRELPPVPAPRHPNHTLAHHNNSSDNNNNHPQEGSPSQNSNIWRRRSLKADVPQLRIPTSHGSTVESIHESRSAGAVPPPRQFAAYSPSSSPQPPQPLSAQPQLTTPAPSAPFQPRSPLAPVSNGLPGRNIRPSPSPAQPQPPSQRAINDSEDDMVLGRKVSHLAAKFLGRKPEENVAESAGSAGNATKPTAPAAPAPTTTTAAAATTAEPELRHQTIERLPTPDYEREDVRTPLVETIRSPISPATSPEMPSTKPSGPHSPSDSIAEPQGAAATQRRDLHAVRSLPDINNPNRPPHRQQQQHPPMPGQFPPGHDPRRQPSRPPSAAESVPPMPVSFRDFPPPQPAFARDHMGRPMPPRGTYNGRPMGPMGPNRFPPRSASFVGMQHPGNLYPPRFAPQPYFVMAPQVWRYGDYEDDIDLPSEENPGSPRQEVEYREMPMGRPQSPEEPEEPIADEEHPIEQPAPLGDKHFSCYIKHEGMREQPNKRCPLMCQSCGVADREPRWACHWCNLRICGGCSEILESYDRDLAKAVAHIEEQPPTSHVQARTSGSSAGLNTVPEESATSARQE